LAAFVLFLTICLGNSTVAAQWVTGANGLTNLALVAALLMGVLALVRRIPWPVALLAGLLLAPLAAYVSAHDALVKSHPNDPGDLIGVAGAWAGRLASGDAANDTAFYVYLLCLLFWVVGGWLSWCSLRWRQPLLGLVPGAAAFATTVLNFPSDQNGYVVAFLVLTLGVLLWTSYVRQLDSAARRRVRLSGDARWDFWESGVVVMAAVIALGLLVPPLSSADRTVDIENGSFRGWAELQQRLNHPVAFGSGATSGTSTGFASLARLAGPIQKTSGVVFTYSIDGSYGGARYFRGFNLDSTSSGAGGPSWRYSEVGAINLPVEKDAAAPYAETYQQVAGGSFKMQMLKPPDRATDVLFYPGTLLKVDRGTTAHNYRGGQPPGSLVPPDRLDTLDRLSVSGRNGGAGSYKVNVQYSTATEDQLRGSGSDYPSWLDPYRNFAGLYRQAADGQVPAPTTSVAYRSRATLQRIQDLARRITAGKDTPYDQAAAIEAYLRANYQYTLTPTEPPAGADPLEYFLFTSKEGYCEYFASAMGDLLRSIGIPTRLVNGFGAGSYDEKLGRYVVKESDAHSWVEAYFPGYGWIPFEPTPDGTYFPIPRGSTGAVCAVDSEVCNAGDVVGAGTGEVNPRPDKGDLLAGDNGLGGGGLGRSPVLGGVPIAALGLLLVLVLAWLAVSRYLRPRSVSGVWKRTSVLSGLAGVRTRAGETPHEFGARLAREIPEAAGPARALAERVAVAAYAPRELAVSSRSGVLAAWAELRPLLLRRVRGRLRLAS
jgi:hypothetical protein